MDRTEHRAKQVVGMGTFCLPGCSRRASRLPFFGIDSEIMLRSSTRSPKSHRKTVHGLLSLFQILLVLLCWPHRLMYAGHGTLWNDRWVVLILLSCFGEHETIGGLTTAGGTRIRRWGFNGQAIWSLRLGIERIRHEERKKKK
jgi:hypothetical protein